MSSGSSALAIAPGQWRRRSDLWAAHPFTLSSITTSAPLTHSAMRTMATQPAPEHLSSLSPQSPVPPSLVQSPSFSPDLLSVGSESGTQSARGTIPQSRLRPHTGQSDITESSLHQSFSTENVLQAALPLFQNSNVPFAFPADSGPNPLASSLARDALLTYAHQMFNSPFQHASYLSIPNFAPPDADPRSPNHPYTTLLLPLLQSLKSLHPRHLPMLLLKGCVHYAVGNYEASRAENEEILRINTSYIEAMSNLGASLKAMGRTEEAILWWWKAILIKPTYWDAINNLLGALVVAEQEGKMSSLEANYLGALRVCDYVKSQLLDRSGRLSIPLPVNELHHLLNIIYISGNIRNTSGEPFESVALQDLVNAVETLLHFSSPRESFYYTFKHFLLAAFVGGLVITRSLPDTIIRLASRTGNLVLSNTLYAQIINLLDFARNADDELLYALLGAGGGTFPSIFMNPDQASYLVLLVFQRTACVAPSLCSWSNTGTLKKPEDDLIYETNKVASNIILSIAKKLQERHSPTVLLPRFSEELCAGPSLILLMYYLSFSFSPSASSFNNIGITLSTTPWADTPATFSGQPEGLVVLELAKAFYEKGLEIDKSHAYLLTNLGSMLKDMNYLDAAIEMYERAVEASPEFDVALANLANAIKDAGRLTVSIPFYRRAVEINEELPEALCGMVHAVWSICDWRGLGHISSGISIDKEGNIKVALNSFAGDNVPSRSEAMSGWMPKLISTTQKQLRFAYGINVGVMKAIGTLENWLAQIEGSIGKKFTLAQCIRWRSMLQPYFADPDREKECINEGGFIIRMVEWLMSLLQWRWYNEAFGEAVYTSSSQNPLVLDINAESSRKYARPRLPRTLVLQGTPSVLPFHTFIYTLSARELRLVAHRTALRVSHSALTRSWLPDHVYPPPSPPHRRINVGYVSSDFMDHPTSHLFQSVPGMHDRSRFRIFIYALSPDDGSAFRQKIKEESDEFRDVSALSTQAIVEEIIKDGIHILVNLNGYTKGARNDIFASRPCPVQISLLGFAGTLAAGWCDYMVCDAIACPLSTRSCELCQATYANMQTPISSLHRETDARVFDLGPDPESQGDWKYVEKLIYMPHSYLVTDHKQTYGAALGGAMTLEQQWKASEDKRRKLRKQIFPDLHMDTIIFANFNQVRSLSKKTLSERIEALRNANQMYKIDPSLFLTWLRILRRVPNSILWLLRFPPAGEEHLIRSATQWAGPDIASRIRFTDVARKDLHIERSAAADLFLDTAECNAHTVAADVLWAGTPILTWPKYSFKMCSRVGASIAYATGFGSKMVVGTLEEYEERAVNLAMSRALPSEKPQGYEKPQGELSDLQRNLFLNRDKMPLFDTLRWTRNLEKGLEEAWKRWVKGGTCSHFTVDGARSYTERCSGFICIHDGDVIGDS